MAAGEINVREEINVLNPTRGPLSDVAWGAVIAGGLAATIITVILMIIGSGLGLMAVSPWQSQGVAAGTLGIAVVAWIIFIQWASAALGGYLAGRLRHRTSYLNSDETLFRDSAHGFLAWAVGTVAVAATASFFAYAVASGTAKVATAAVQGAAAGAAANANESSNGTDWLGYYTDSLFRADPNIPTDPALRPTDADARAETSRIIMRGLANGDMAPTDRTYLAQVVSQRTGLGLPEAQQRVDQVIGDVKAAETKVREAADKARKASAKLAMFLALSMVIGAFIASAMAAFGGKLRDEPNP